MTWTCELRKCFAILLGKAADVCKKHLLNITQDARICSYFDSENRARLRKKESNRMERLYVCIKTTNRLEAEVGSASGDLRGVFAAKSVSSRKHDEVQQP